MAATSIMIIQPFNTVSVPPSSFSLPSSFQSCRNGLNTGRIIGKRTYILGFPQRSTPTDNNPILLSKFADDSDESGVHSSSDSASDVVRKFYRGINSRNLSSVEELIADDCVYDDLVFPKPFVGRKAILEFFEKFIYSISADLQFAIDDISGEDTSAVGVTWHLEWKGKPFPFSKGCSFYRLEVVNGCKKIIYGRDIVEPAVKPGDFALVAIRGVTWLLQQFPHLEERL